MITFLLTYFIIGVIVAVAALSAWRDTDKNDVDKFHPIIQFIVLILVILSWPVWLGRILSQFI